MATEIAEIKNPKPEELFKFLQELIDAAKIETGESGHDPLVIQAGYNLDALWQSLEELTQYKARFEVLNKGFVDTETGEIITGCTPYAQERLRWRIACLETETEKKQKRLESIRNNVPLGAIHNGQVFVSRLEEGECKAELEMCFSALTEFVQVNNLGPVKDENYA